MAESAEPSPHSFVPPPRTGPRDSGDGWVEDGTGRKFWGRFGAAGLLAYDPLRGADDASGGGGAGTSGASEGAAGAGGSILLQHRANWSHFGGTWGLPGGAKHAGESSVEGAVREANEEAGVPTDALRLSFTSTLDLGFWSYTTVVADVTSPFDAEVADAESIEVRWVPVEEVATLPLHPGFEAAWGDLRRELSRPVVLIVDSANVVGSRPNGWWKDRLGATNTFAGRLQALARLGFTGDSLGIPLPRTRWWPETVLVVEGQARDARVEQADDASPHSSGGGLRITAAAHDGDQAIVDTVASYAAPDARGGVAVGAPDARGGAVADADGVAVSSRAAPRIFVVTADRELSDRVTALGATVHGPGWLWALLDDLDDLDA